MKILITGANGEVGSDLVNFMVKKNHKIYIAKDFCFNNKDLRNNYKNFNKFLKVKKK